MADWVGLRVEVSLALGNGGPMLFELPLSLVSVQPELVELLLQFLVELLLAANLVHLCSLFLQVLHLGDKASELGVRLCKADPGLSEALLEVVVVLCHDSGKDSLGSHQTCQWA